MIQFITNITEDINLQAYNNNVIEFYSDTTAKTSITANISIADKFITIYPKPDGSFYFNFKEYVSQLVNPNNFVDLINPELDASDVSTFSYIGVGNLSSNVTIKINFTDLTNEIIVKSLLFLPSVEQLDGYKKGIVQQGSFIVLSPLIPNADAKYYVKYWEGYPFDISFLQLTYPTPPADGIPLTNNTNLLSYEFEAKAPITRLFFSDGNTDESINDLLPIALGENEIQYSDRIIVVDKQDVCEGIYLKWFNNYGGYSYWKFDNIFKRTTNSKSIGEIVTDYSNLNQTFSNTSEIGKTAGEKIQVNTDNLTDNELSLLKPLLISPKVYLFVGQPFARASQNDWVEVKISSTSYTTRNFKGQPTKLAFTLELPDLYTQTL